ncbi:MAG: DUF2070 family protein [Candidatus Marsarchaeota archaeon]|nr:DUF2070 family protein [Candidatus Marsarchaeota archaeon]MCL5106203.1 DUF2070 family protein [Candidatus Marsarchaeota archaeon]
MKKKDDISRFVGIFSKSLPNKYVLFIALLFSSISIGMLSIAVVNHRALLHSAFYIAITGSLTGLIAIAIPSLFTISIIKLVNRKITLKHVFFLTLLALFIYSIFFILSNIIYLFTNAYAASLAIILGNILIFSEWFFIAKIIFGMKKKAVIVSLVQPTFNLILYAPASNFLFKVAMPLNILMLKFYLGVSVFVIISYLILYLFDKPMKKSLGFNTMETLSNLFQNWMFDINVSNVFGEKFGEYRTVEANTILLKDKKSRLKAIFFAPDVHYGPFSTIGGSNFPHLLEAHANSRHRAPAFIMHPAVNEDLNPVSSLQIGRLKECMDAAIKNAECAGDTDMGFFSSSLGDSHLTALDFGAAAMVSFSRAPKVTEDVSSDAREALKNLLLAKFKNPVLLDAHNSRYETAPAAELKGIQLNSKYYKDYANAIDLLKETARGRLKAGIGTAEFYYSLGKPKDLAPGNINVAIFSFDGHKQYKHALILFNANNMSPALRKQVLDHIAAKYKLPAEVYTTDTHYVNSISESAKNVFGNYTNFSLFKDALDNAVDAAVKDICDVKVYYNKQELNKFLVWGSNIREKMFTVLNSILSTAKLIIPLLIIFGLIVAVWVISYI